MGGRRTKKRQEPPPSFNESRNAVPTTRGKKRRASGEIITTLSKQHSGGSKAKSSKGAFMSGALNDGDNKSHASKATATVRAAGSDEISEDDDAADFLDGFEAGASEEELDAGDIEIDGQAFDSEEDTHPEARLTDGTSSDSEDELTAANMESRSRRLDAAQRTDAAAAELELQEAGLHTNISGERPRILEDDGASDTADHTFRSKSSLLAPDLQLLRTRIIETVRVLDSFSSLREESRSRSEYVSQLLKDICAYYGYSEFLAEKLFNLFSPREAFDFFEANESARPIVIRTNTLKTHRRELAQALIARGITLEPVGKWSKIGLQVFESPVPLGATPEYLAGHYMLQAASSFLPVMALNPQEHERILDMAAAPGGKTCHVSAAMRNTGVIFANDPNKARAKALVGNIHRLGVKNTIVTALDAKAFPKTMSGFDRVLLDAPCSGTGVIAKDPSVKTNKGPKDFLRLPHEQKQLLLCAIDSVDQGGVIVYSTCSVIVEENEAVVQYALNKRPNVKIEDTGLGGFGVPAFKSYMGKTFDQGMEMARRYYPHTYNVDGFFVCRLRKTGPSPGTRSGVQTSNGNGAEVDIDRDETGEGLQLNVDRSLSENVLVTGVEDFERDGDDFGGWDDGEDEVYLERARRRRLKREGHNLKANRMKSQNADGD